MEVIWQRIKAWLKTNAPEVYEDLQSGADEDEIFEAEEYLKIKFPEDFRNSLKIHNGQKGSEDKFLIDGFELLSLEKIMEEWDALDELIKSGDFEEIKSTSKGNAIKDDWWNPKWIPFTHSGSGDYYCLDLAPGPEGKTGQIISIWKDLLDRDLVANSFKELLENFARDLELDKYELMEEYDGLVLKES